MVDQVRRIELFLGAVAERVDKVALVGPDALGRAPDDVNIPVGEEPLTKDKSRNGGGGLSKLVQIYSTRIAAADCNNSPLTLILNRCKLPIKREAAGTD